MLNYHAISVDARLNVSEIPSNALRPIERPDRIFGLQFSQNVTIRSGVFQNFNETEILSSSNTSFRSIEKGAFKLHPKTTQRRGLQMMHAE